MCNSAIMFKFFNSSTSAPEIQGAVESTATDQTLEADTVLRGHETQTSRQWRDLVTPQLPLDMSLTGQLSRSIAER